MPNSKNQEQNPAESEPEPESRFVDEGYQFMTPDSLLTPEERKTFGKDLSPEEYWEHAKKMGFPLQEDFPDDENEENKEE